MAYANIEQVAHVLNLSPRRIQQLVKNEGMPRINRGEYDLVKCVHWYIAHLTQRMEAARRGTSETESQARARYISAIADLKQMDVLERKGEVVRNTAVMGVIQPLLTSVRSILLSFPRRVAILVAPSNMDDFNNVEHMVDEFVRDQLDQIAALPKKLERLSQEKREKWEGMDLGAIRDVVVQMKRKKAKQTEPE